MGALFKLIVIQMELLGHLGPPEAVEEVVEASLVEVRLDLGLHHGPPGDPDSLLLVVSPVSVVAVKRN